MPILARFSAAVFQYHDGFMDEALRPLKNRISKRSDEWSPKKRSSFSHAPISSISPAQPQHPMSELDLTCGSNADI